MKETKYNREYFIPKMRSYFNGEYFKKKCTHVHKDAPENCVCEDCYEYNKMLKKMHPLNPWEDLKHERRNQHRDA